MVWGQRCVFQLVRDVNGTPKSGEGLEAEQLFQACFSTAYSYVRSKATGSLEWQLGLRGIELPGMEIEHRYRGLLATIQQDASFHEPERKEPKVPPAGNREIG